MKSIRKHLTVWSSALLLTCGTADLWGDTIYETNTTLTTSPAWSENVQINDGVSVVLGENVLPGQTTNVTVNIDGSLTLNFTKGDNHAASNSFTNANGKAIAFTGAGTLIKVGSGRIASASGAYTSTGESGTRPSGGADYYAVKFAMDSGALIDIQAGTLVNGGYYYQDWTENKADLQIASGASVDVWDGDHIYVDSMVGAGSFTNGTDTARCTVAFGMDGSTWFDADGNAVTPDFSGSFTSGKRISLKKKGTGTQILSGTIDSTGNLTVESGVLQIGNGGATGSIGENMNVEVFGGTLVFNSDVASTLVKPVSGTGTIDVQRGFVGFDSAANTFTGTLNVSGGSVGIADDAMLAALKKGTVTSGSRLMFLIGATSDETLISMDDFAAYRAGSVADGVAIGIYVPAGQTTSVDVSSGILDVNSELPKTGAGTFQLTGENSTFTSKILVEEGIFALGNGTAAGAISPSVPISVSSGAAFAYNNGAETETVIMNQISGDGAIRIQSGTVKVTDQSPTYQQVSGSGSYATGYVTFDVSSLVVENGAKLSFASGFMPLFNKNSTVTVDGVMELNSTLDENHKYNNSFVVLSTAMTINGTGTILKTGTGATALLCRNGYSGSVTVDQGVGGWFDVQQGVLISGGWSGNINWTSNQGSMNVASGARLNLWDGTGSSKLYIDNLTGAGTVQRGLVILGVANNTNSETYGVTNNTAEFSGVIQNGSNSAAVEKRGTGTQILSGSNTYTGTTTVRNGTLQIGKGGDSGKIGTGAVLIGENGNLTFKTTQENTVASLQSSGTLSMENSGKLTVNSAPNVTSVGTLNVESESDLIQFNFAADSSGTIDGNVTGNGTIALNTNASNSVFMHRAGVAESANVSISGGSITVGDAFEGTLKVTADTNVSLAAPLYTAWKMTEYTDSGNASGTNGRVAPENSLTVEETIYADSLHMDQAANSTDNGAVGNYISNYSTLSYKTHITVLENLTLDFSGSFDDTQGVWVIQCDENGKIAESAEWTQLLGFAGNCAVNTATGVELAAGTYIMDVRVVDQSGEHKANGGVKDANGKSLGIGMRVSGSSHYSAMTIDAETGAVGGSDGKIIVGNSLTDTLKWGDAKLDIAEGVTARLDNADAAIKEYEIDASVTGKGTLALTDTAGSTKYDLTIDSEGSVTAADGMDLTLSGAIDGDLELGADTILNFVVDAAHTGAELTVGGDASLGEGSTINVFIAGEAPEGGDILKLLLLETQGAEHLHGFESALLNISAEDMNLRFSSEFLDGSFYLTMGNSNSLPEPGTWVMLLCGLGIFGGMRKVRKQKLAGKI